MAEFSNARKMPRMDIRLQAIKKWLEDDLRISDYTIKPASADASFRRYFRITFDDQSLIIMDAPPDKEDCSPFVDITNRLLKIDLNSPEVKAHDVENGFLLLSDLGQAMYLDKLDDDNADTLYKAAIDSLITMQIETDVSALPTYDQKLLAQEMQLFPDWLLKQYLGLPYKGLENIFSFLTQSALEQPRVFVHRDYHSRNLTWQPNQKPGILDFQDAVLGPVSYDLVSLLRDCYIEWPQNCMINWVKYYCETMRKRGFLTDVSNEEFLRWFDLMGIQRHLKASGIFARLWLRDNKQGYLKDIPRTLNYIIKTSGQYPELQELKSRLTDEILPAILNKELPNKENLA
ncbi:MAG: aminoglycoside phosphotransferase family protein [Gammaproteobacteria bacterium]